MADTYISEVSQCRKQRKFTVAALIQCGTFSQASSALNEAWLNTKF